VFSETQATSPLNIDKSKTGLVVIDLQKGVGSFPVVPHDSKTVVSNAARLADAFREHKMPVFLVRVVSSEAERLKPIADSQIQFGGSRSADWAEFIPEIGPKDGDITITKKQWGAFYGTDLELHLRRRGIDTIVLCGIATNYGVESTARFAYEYGFQQIFAEDACAAISAEAHGNTVNYVFKRMGRVRSTEEILRSLLAP